MDLKKFENPSAEYRDKPFWALNGKLEKTELERQINVMKEMGFGGAFLHSRTGLETDYMSDEWLDRIEDCVNQSAKLGLQAFLYDEDRWPSGTAGGYVTEKEEYRLKSVYMEKIDRTVASDCLFKDKIAVFAVIFSDINVCEKFRKIHKISELRENEEIVAFDIRTMPNQPFYNGYSYVDNMDKKAVDEFINLTHEKYKKRMGKRFGKDVYGIFTDEPHRGPLFNGFAISGENDPSARVPYTEGLFEAFEKKYGYSLIDNFPKLYFKQKGEKFSEISWQYIELCLELFIENFAENYHGWCKKNNLIFTGHILHEDNLAAIVTMCGSMMRFYEHMDIPGMDNLTANNTCLAVPKMVSSVKRQFDKEGVLSELYAATGWNTDFATYKRIGDWQEILGVTLRCPHLSWYTMKGSAKRDYPASLLHQAVWHKEFKYVEDYFARFNYFLSQGKKKIDLLVIHPNESAWGLSHYGTYVNSFATTDERYNRLEKDYYETCNSLLTNGIDFDYGDEEIMSRIGVAEKGMLKVGCAEYKRVLISGLINLRSTTLKLLKEFISNGGEVVIYGDLPEFLDCKPYDFGMDFIGAHILSKTQKLQDYFLKNTDLKVTVKESGKYAENILTSTSVKGEDIYFALINHSDEKRKLAVCAKGNYQIIKCDLRRGKLYEIPYKNSQDSTVAEIELDGREECCLCYLSEFSDKFALLTEEKFKEVENIPTSFEYSLEKENVCVLDRAKCVAGGIDFGVDEILQLDIKIREKFGMQKRESEMIQPWFKKKFFADCKANGRSITLEYEFDVKSIPEKVKLVMEQMDRYTIKLNGKPIDASAKTGFEWDVCYDSVSIDGGLFKLGKNTLILDGEMTEDLQLESMFFIGNFGVLCGLTNTLTTLPERLEVGSVTTQGLPFYSGGIRYKIPLKKGEYKLKFDRLGAPVVRVGADGSTGEILAFKPYEIKGIKTEKSLDIITVCSQQNTFGPLHLLNPVGSSGAPHEFTVPKPYSQDGYGLVEQGLLEIPKIYKKI